MDIVIIILAVLLTALCITFVIAFIVDLPDIKYKPSPIGYVALSLTCIAATGYGSYALWAS